MLLTWGKKRRRERKEEGEERQTQEDEGKGGRTRIRKLRRKGNCIHNKRTAIKAAKVSCRNGVMNMVGSQRYEGKEEERRGGCSSGGRFN